MPRSVPDLPGFHISHSYRTANEVGGDYYDFSLLEDGRLALMVGDASGHGMAAGLLMAIANATLGLAIDLDPSPPAVLRLLNRTLCRTGGTRAFMSIFYALLDPQHPARSSTPAPAIPFPLLRRTTGRSKSWGRAVCRWAFGATSISRAARFASSPATCWCSTATAYPKESIAHSQTFGYEQLHQLVALPGTPPAIHERILRAFDAHRGEQPLEDDFSLVVVGRDAA